MNTKKGKNKKPNKSPNPKPQQTPENVKVPEKVDDIPIVVKVESELKIDERVPEITSDVTTASEVCKEVQVESPKKPKRNKGKKKKQDKDSETEENQEGHEKAASLVLAEDKKISAEIKASDVKIETIIPEIENVTPTSRKKKNKNKKAGNQDTTPFEEEKVEETPPETTTAVIDITESEKVSVPCDITPEVLVKPTEEVQPAKKKNKKKKRHDSEKSDKAEEISCTTAFQKLLTLDDEKSKDIEEQQIFDSILSVEDVSDTIADVPDDNKEKEMLDLNKENVKEDVFKTVGGKNKKKNKKGKISKIDDEQQVESRNESQCEVVSEDNPIISTDILNPATDMVMEKIDDTKIPSEGFTIETLPEDERAKPKAKNAKSVDKKGKEKPQLVAKDKQSESSILEVPKITENVVKVTAETLHTKEIALQEMVKPKEIPLMDNVKDEAILASLVELINIPQSGTGKKRKKSPKPQKDTQEIKKESDGQCTMTHETEKSTKNKEESSVSESVIAIEMPLLSDQQKESLIPDPVIVLKSESEPVQERLSETLETKHDVLSVSKPGKKRKKSPKPPTKLEIGETSKLDKERDQNVTETKETLTKHENDEMTDIYFDMPHMEEIEIRSVKTDDSEESTCGVRPDSIQYPRANSQQQADDNNNTVIQEVFQTDDTKLAIPIMMPDTPFIQGDTLLASPEMLSVGVADTEVSVVKTNESEKTDLKSKMMEVNQDMEELRLSIEKSLAELTSMEKKEEEVEKQYEKQIQSQSQDSKKLDTSVLEVNLGSIAVKLEEKITDLAAENKNVATKIESSPIPPETDILAPLIMPMPTDIIKEVESLKEDEQQKHSSSVVIPPPPPMPVFIKEEEMKQTIKENKPTESSVPSNSPPVCPARKDQKGKGKSKKKGKQEVGQTGSPAESTSTGTKEASKETKKEHKTEASQEKGKQHSNIVEATNNEAEEPDRKDKSLPHFEPIENFEDAMTSSIDDVNKSFEMIATEAQNVDSHVNPEIKIIAPLEDTKVEKKDEKINPVSQPKNLLGHPVIPVRSNKMDYKKEKNKSPNAILAKVKIKDSVQIQKKQSKESQTENIQKFMKKKSIDESFSTLMNENEEFVYKYSFRKVFLPSVCHVCNKDLKQTRVACSYCNLLFYCSSKHKDEDWPKHQALCFAVSTIVHLKEQKHIYEDAKNITGHNYRLLRMQMIVSCEKILKRKLLPWEQEALLYPRMCSDIDCREWRQNKLVDCDGCWQIAYCFSHPDHLPSSHKKWCKSYSLYQKLVCHQQTKGRLEPKMPSGVITEQCQIPDTMNEVLASMYKEKIDMTDVEYAALTQLATAPLTAVYSFQMYNNKMNSIYANGTYKKSSFTVHVMGAELQFEADALNKWELFFLHLRPDIKNLTICLIASNLNPSNLPLELLGKVRLCEYCRQNKRRLLFSFQDKKSYSEYYKSDDFTSPDMVCTFNPSIQRSTIHNGNDTWPSTINTILKQKIPFVITSYSMEELYRDLGRIKECSQVEFNIISEPKLNSFSSVRPDRNFITDEEMPLLFKNYCFAVICGVF